jgi:hypothetical protein
MLPALCDDQRCMLARLALMVCCGCCAVLPLTVRSSIAADAAAFQAAVPLRSPSALEPLRYPLIRLRRDPFVADGLSEVALHGDAGAQLENEPNAIPVIQAVVLGKNARALVEQAGAISVVALGDSLAGSTVAAIDSHGVILSSGARLMLAGPLR